MEPTIEPTVSELSPLFELRAWRRELDRLSQLHADNPPALEAVAQAKREVLAWIRARERPQSAG